MTDRANIAARAFAKHFEIDSSISATFQPETKLWEVRFLVKARDPQMKSEAVPPPLMAIVDALSPSSPVKL
jgi:hypothetical protein